MTKRSKRNIAFLTATRADFGKLKSLMKAVSDSDEFECSIFATGMHMLARYGSTINEIYKSGFHDVHPYINQDGSVNSQMDLVLANTVSGLGLYVRESKPDLLVVHGDRVEALGGAIVGALNNIRVAHIEGGEVSGTVDEVLRHAVTKLSHLHFVANEEAAARLRQMGEASNSIFVIGSPDTDIMFSDSLPTLQEVKNRYEIPFDRYGIVLYHPVTTELEHTRRDASELVSALIDSGMNFVIIHPNNDHGAEAILQEMERLRGVPRFRFIPSMRFEHFLVLMRNGSAVVGNSSAGIREAPSYGVPTVNIGTRQNRRFHCDSILNVDPARDAILSALTELPKGFAPVHHFGKGNCGPTFLNVLRDEAIWALANQKVFNDVSGFATSSAI
ncbi:MAG TPA: UDP-N-acetylglucosamine 2-epimerase [Candidatus Sulfotelmatobacter sp.]|nr:UDP-N-acetylglucosamine 2-epimerase [Candidatus Sulfotelmatobacter sp.]